MSAKTYRATLCFAKLFFKYFLKSDSFISLEDLFDNLNTISVEFKKPNIEQPFLFLKYIKTENADSIFQKVIQLLKINQDFYIFFQFLWQQNKLDYLFDIINLLKKLVLSASKTEICHLYFSHILSEEIICRFKSEITRILGKKTLFKIHFKSKLYLGFRALTDDFIFEKNLTRNFVKINNQL